jgi:Domain of unknown function (DUF4336)
MLERWDEGIWIADGPPVSFYGFPYPTRMTVVRLADGGVWVCSPIRLEDEMAAAIDGIGPLRHIVEPNKIHHLHLAAWAQRWPEARLYAPPGLARRRPDLSFDAELGDQPSPAWSADIDQVIFRGSAFMEEVVFFHRKSRTAIFTDLIQRFPANFMSGWRGWIMKLDGLVGERGSTPREWRLTFLQRGRARAALRKVLSWDPRRLVIAHGECAREDGREVIATSLRWLGVG